MLLASVRSMENEGKRVLPAHCYGPTEFSLQGTAYSLTSVLAIFLAHTSDPSTLLVGGHQLNSMWLDLVIPCLLEASSFASSQSGLWASIVFTYVVSRFADDRTKFYLGSRRTSGWSDLRVPCLRSLMSVESVSLWACKSLDPAPLWRLPIDS